MKNIFLCVAMLLKWSTLFTQEIKTHDRTLTEPLILADKIIYTTSGLIFAEDEDIKLGTGTLPNGDFKYITFSRNNLVIQSNYPYLGGKWSGHKFHIKRIQQYGTKKRGYTWYLILGGGNIVNYECDIENAIKFGEIDVPEKFKTGLNRLSGNTTIINQGSIADELVKLKKLLEDGILTQEEYDTQKKKLLEKN